MVDDYSIGVEKALRILSEKWQATRAELAMWIAQGEADDSEGGIEAYVGVDLNPPTRFFWSYYVGRKDYESALAHLWFRRCDIERFVPTDRFVTGKDLIERWSNLASSPPEAYISARIAESRLFDMHPSCGGTQARLGVTCGDDTNPPLEDGLFSMQQIEQIEAEDGIIPHLPAAVPDLLAEGGRQVWPDDARTVVSVPSILYSGKTPKAAYDALKAAGFSDEVAAYVLNEKCNINRNKTEMSLFFSANSDASNALKQFNRVIRRATERYTIIFEE